MANSTRTVTITSAWVAHQAGAASVFIENPDKYFDLYYSVQPTGVPPMAADIGHLLKPGEIKPTKPIVVGSSLFIRHLGTTESADQKAVLTDEV